MRSSLWMRPAAGIGLLALMAGCSSDAPAPSAPEFAKGVASADPTVTAVDPDSVPQDTVATIKVFGTGFDRGSTVDFIRHGTTDDKLDVTGVKFVSAKEVDATVSVGAATLGTYDVALTTSGGKKGVGSELVTVVLGDPTVDWLVPLDDASLSIRSDGNYGDGTYSVYSDGTCGVTTHLFATTQLSASGDAKLQTKAARKNTCGRRFAVVYPDGQVETLGASILLAALQSPTQWIPLGTTAPRHMNFAPGGRCGTLYFGPGKLGNGVGSDSLLVTRLDASTWRVRSNPASHKVLCGNTGELFDLLVEFTLRASRPLAGN